MQTAKILSSTKLERGRKGGWEGKKTPTAAVCVATGTEQWAVCVAA